MGKNTKFMGLVICVIIAGLIYAEKTEFDGLNMGMGNLPLLSHAKSRSISPENPTGEKGKGGMAKIGEGSASEAAADLGQGWKVNPYVKIEPNQTVTFADIQGPGVIQRIWMTPSPNSLQRLNILRIYWDGEQTPSVECPAGDFFASGWNIFAQVSSLPICSNPASGFNCYWPMPFRKSCKITMTNIGIERVIIFYQVDYALTEVPKDAAYFHAQFRRTNPVPFKQVYTIVDGIKGQGHYVGTYMAWQVNSNGWWGEGEIKFYMDGDTEFPTICGTGTEDYFGGSYCFKAGSENLKEWWKGKYTTFTTPYAGMPQIIRPNGEYQATTRFGLYRWHIMDPIRFEKDLKVTMQDLGWYNGLKKYMPLQDDISSVAYWYQTEPHAPFPKLPDREHLEVIVPF